MGNVFIRRNSQETMEKEMTYTNLKNGLSIVETKNAIRDENKIKAIQDNVTDLYWEYDRMSSCGQKSLDALAKLTDVPTNQDIQKRLKQYHKDTA